MLPAVTLGYGATAIIARMMRSALVEELQQDYVDAARAKGLAEKTSFKETCEKKCASSYNYCYRFNFWVSPTGHYHR